MHLGDSRIRRSDRPAFVVRTIRDGTVRIIGKTYAVDEQHMPYDGRLDGLRYAFGRYGEGWDMVCLWGTEAAWEATKRNASFRLQARYEQGDCYGPELVDGAFPWTWWREVTA